MRALGGKTLVWGRVALRLSDYDFKGKSHDGFGEDWPISYADLAPYYDKVDTILGISGTKENLPQLPDGIFQRPIKLTCGEQILRKAIAPMGRHLIPGRAGVTTDGVVTNRYRSRCMGRGRCGRGCDISGVVQLADRRLSIPRRTRDAGCSHGLHRRRGAGRSGDEPAPRASASSIGTPNEHLEFMLARSWSLAPRRSSPRGCC